MALRFVNGLDLRLVIGPPIEDAVPHDLLHRRQIPVAPRTLDPRLGHVLRPPPDPRVAGSAIYSWIAEDLLLYGVAYGMVMDAYAATDASRIRAWTRIAPGRVFASLNGNSTEIEYYTVDAASTPAPFNNTASFNPFIFTQSVATRQQAMAVPTVARARNIICSTLASLPLEQYSKIDGSHMGTPAVINQPDPRVPGSAIYAWLAEDLLFYGVGYGQVLEQYGDTGRVRAWTRVSPDRVTTKLNNNQTEIVGYQVDGSIVPNQGVGSLVVFYGLDEGVLNRAGRTIRAAHALEQAAETFAKEPVPLQVLKSNGTNLPAERISKLLELSI